MEENKMHLVNKIFENETIRTYGIKKMKNIILVL